LFDQLVSQGITFRNYGEMSGGAAPLFSDDGRPTYQQVRANSNQCDYPSEIFNGCLLNEGAPNSPLCAFDCGLGCKGTAVKAQSRIDSFNREFQAQLLAGKVPHFNYLIMMSDHTNGVSSGARDPLSMVADNDLGVGQLVELVSHSDTWSESAIFVVEDDSQDGADHVDAHRAPALVIGPYVKHGGEVVHTRYDQLSVIRTIELILGLQPLSVFDAVATPMYDAFMPTPDDTPYTAIQPEKSLLDVCPCPNSASNEALSAALPYNEVDRVPQAINDRILWQRVHGAASPPPPPGPNASRLEAARADAVLKLYAQYARNPDKARKYIAEYLRAVGEDDD